MAGLREMAEDIEEIPAIAANGRQPGHRLPHQNEIRINICVRDQHSIFGNFVATKLRAIDERVLNAVKFEIEQLLIEAERAHPNYYFPPDENALLRNDLRNFVIYTPHPPNQPFIFPFFTVNHPFVPNLPCFCTFPSVPIIEAFVPPMPMMNGPERRPPMNPPFNENNHFQPPAQRYYNFRVPSDIHGRPQRRNGQNANNSERNFGGPRNNNVQQQNNSAGSSSTFRNNPLFSGTARNESSRTNRP